MTKAKAVAYIGGILLLVLAAGCRESESAKCKAQAERLGVEYVSMEKTNHKDFAGGQQYACWVHMQGELVNLWK
ncbi:hypothetical protein LCGC14_2621890 [marine sediment metagenome]|uniref:Uncharacterized protein n=1 Tax=marine sediment metagenome TaxID=412755 RepID=A0A0F9A2S0_9ZZZZ